MERKVLDKFQKQALNQIVYNKWKQYSYMNPMDVSERTNAKNEGRWYAFPRLQGAVYAIQLFKKLQYKNTLNVWLRRYQAEFSQWLMRLCLPQVCVLRKAPQCEQNVSVTDWIRCSLPAADLAAITSSLVEGDPTPAPSPCQKVRKRIEGGTNLLDKMNERWVAVAICRCDDFFVVQIGLKSEVDLFWNRYSHFHVTI
jgi:hypothetical protein